MLFNSYVFIFLFLPITFLGFFCLSHFHSKKLAITWLTIASFFFYAYWNPPYVILMFLSIIFNHQIGKLIENSPLKSKKATQFLWLGIIVDLLLIGYYKYAGFFASSLNSLLATNLPVKEFFLPLGISFYTFTQIAYLVDAYQGQTKEARYNLLNYSLFVVFFPHLIAGPIVHHKDIMPQFSKREIYQLNSENIAVGITIFFIGLFKKVVLADHVANYANPVFDAAANGESINFLVSWCGVLAYSLQLYFDFSGYSDMAIGASRMFGIDLPINFNSPYKATNISDFWRRWHITLSNFLRDYLYIPLGGNRKGEIRRNFNLMTTMLLGGLWHGAGWNFVFWGGLHGIYLVINRQWQNFRKYLGHDLTKSSWLSQTLACLITFLSVIIAWVFFRSANMKTAFLILEGMIGLHGIVLPTPLEKYLSFLSPWGIKFEGTGTLGFAVSDALIWIFSLLIIVWFIPNTQQWMENYQPGLNYKPSQTSRFWQKLQWKPTNIWVIISTIITVIAVFHLAQDNEFIYFQF